MVGTPGKLLAAALLAAVFGPASAAPGEGEALQCGASGACEEAQVELAEEALSASMCVEMLQVAGRPFRAPGRAPPPTAEAEPDPAPAAPAGTAAGLTQGRAEEKKAAAVPTVAAAGLTPGHAEGKKAPAAPAGAAAGLAQGHSEGEKAPMSSQDYCASIRREGFFCMGSSRVHCCMSGLLFRECGTETCMHGCANNICIETSVSTGYSPMMPYYNPMMPYEGYDPMMPYYNPMMPYETYHPEPYYGYHPPYETPGVDVNYHGPAGTDVNADYHPGYGYGVGYHGPEGREVGIHVRH